MPSAGNVVEGEIFIAAAPATVFEFFRDPALMALWIGRGRVVEARPGGQLRIEMSAGNIASGRYTVIDPPRRIAFTWGWEAQNFVRAELPPEGSLVEIELEPRDGGTLVHLRHSGLPGGMLDMHRERWGRYLVQLKSAAVQRAPSSTVSPPSTSV
jgi:uncharacterized protein YndB with AHSA1/START domain